MGPGLAFQLFYMVAFWALFLEHGKCQVLYQVFSPLDYGLDKSEKITCYADYSLLISHTCCTCSVMHRVFKQTQNDGRHG